MPTNETRKPLMIISQGRAPRLELAFVRGGRALAYVVPADERSQECFDAMREIAETWKRKRGKKP